MKKIIPKESHEQIQLVQYLNLKRVLYFAPMNENTFSGIIRAIIKPLSRANRIICSIVAKARKMGTQKGVCDVWILEPRNGFHGLIIELKRIEGSTTTKEQIEWVNNLNKRGYKAVICKGFIEAQKVVDEYLKEARIN